MTRLPRRASQAALLLAVALAASSAQAVEYETDIDIDNESDLYEMSARGEIGSTTLETLIDLLHQGVDLNAASREDIYELPGLAYEDVDAILKYRELTRINDPADLVGAGAITQEQLLEIAPFLVLRAASDIPLTGYVRAMSAYSTDDRDGPPAFLEAQAKGPVNLSAGILAITKHLALANVRYSIDQQGLVADKPDYRFYLPKFFLQWKTPMFQVLAGTFRIGFGQRLTLDNTTRWTPDGFYPDNVVTVPSDDLSRYCHLSGGDACGPEAVGLYVTPDFSAREGFRGVAASVRHIPLGSAELALHAFGSYQNHGIYQYEIFDLAKCTDPRDDSDPACAAPPVFVAGATDQSKYAFSVLPDVYDEIAAGGNASVTFSPGTHIGVTGYWANDRWRIDGASVDFQEWSNRPWGGPFGAVGIDGAAKAGRFNLFAEVTRSFDGLPGGGGGFGALGRLVAAIAKGHQLEASLRYYDKKFVNPISRPISDPDEFQGQPARNETGVHLKYWGKPSLDWVVVAEVDVSVWPDDGEAVKTAGLTDVDLYLRADFVGWRKAKISAWGEYINKDVAVSGFDQCYTRVTYDDSYGNPLPCAGEFFRIAARAAFQPLGKKLGLAAQYQHEVLNDPRYKNQKIYRQDIMAWVDLTSQPIDLLRIRWRTRYLNDAIEDNTYLEQSIFSYLELGFLPDSHWDINLRYGAYGFLDQRASTLLRKSPLQHRFRLELEARF